MRGLFAALSAALLFRAGRTQCTEVTPAQYAGTSWDNNLQKTHTLSDIAFFKIKDPSGQHVCTSDPASDLSLLTYLSLNSTRGRLPNNAIRRLVIVLSGANSDAWDYHKHLLDSLQAMNDPDINPNSVAILSPYFPNDKHAGSGFPYDPNGATPDQKYPSPALVWYSTEWSGGANNQYPPRLKTVSAYDALDQIIQYYGNTDIFPNMKHIVVSGHSMGAQMLHRYAAVGKTRAQLGVRVPVSYYIANPSSFTWFTNDRPLSTGKCANAFNKWREGLASYATYGSEHSGPLTYNSALLNAGGSAVLANYRVRLCSHSCFLRGMLAKHSS